MLRVVSLLDNLITNSGICYFSSFSEEGKSSLSYEYGWRRISDPSKRASKEVLQHLGDSMKSSLVYTFAANKIISIPRAGTMLFDNECLK